MDTLNIKINLLMMILEQNIYDDKYVAFKKTPIVEESSHPFIE